MKERVGGPLPPPPPPPPAPPRAANATRLLSLRSLENHYRILMYTRNITLGLISKMSIAIRGYATKLEIKRIDVSENRYYGARLKLGIFMNFSAGLKGPRKNN